MKQICASCVGINVNKIIKTNNDSLPKWLQHTDYVIEFIQNQKKIKEFHRQSASMKMDLDVGVSKVGKYVLYWGAADSHSPLIKDAKKSYYIGFRIYKMRVIDPNTVINLVKAFKKEFGNKMDLIVDAVQGSTSTPWSTKVSINLAKELEEYKILFFEEPCRVENLEGYKDIKQSTNLNIAGAESIPTARAFKPYLDANVFDIVQFDIATSGFTEGRRIADLAYVHNKSIAIHSWGSAISIMAGLHFSLSIPNSAFTEYCFMDHPINEHLFEEGKLTITNGYINKPKTYGLGVKFDESIISKYPYKEKINTMISTVEEDIKLV